MGGFKSRLATRLALSASVLAMIAVPGVAAAQDQTTPDTSSTMGQPGTSQIGAQQSAPTSETQTDPSNGASPDNDIVVTGIRASLRETIDIKRNSQGVVDAISAEDIGKFPDTNLAESLQRITGVSIDRTNGEGSTVTVRGFGPEYNLVTLNGRQLPTSTLGDGASPPASRSFDFANLASEGISAVEVYKTGRASVPSGGIGSTINIRTPRPLDKLGLRGSIAAKGVLDTSRNGKNPVTPEVSGIISDTFADGKIGILLDGVYQRRKSSTNTGSVGFRDGFLGSENNWGTLAQPGTPGAQNITNRPGPNDVYEIPQSAAYDLVDVDRERINGQAVLQVRPVDSLTATVDFTYSRNKVEARDSSVGIWFNFGDTSSSFTDGPSAGPNFYTERFGPGKDLSYSGALSANVSENKSLGGNLTWDAPGNVTVSLDAHHSTAESRPTNKYGSSTSLGNAIFGVQTQTIDFTRDLPVFSYQMYPGINPLDASLITPTGDSFRNAFFRDRINQVQLTGHYDHNGDFLDSLDFGFSYVNNKVRSAYGFIQNDTWGGIGPASDLPDDIFTQVSLPDKFKGISGAKDIPAAFYTFDFNRMADLLESKYQVCSKPQTGSSQNGSCLADYTVDRRITEQTISPFIQANAKFDIFSRPAHLIGGVRYDETQVDSSALVPVPTGTSWNSANEISLIQPVGNSGFTSFKGRYHNWLPAVDFDVEPLNNVKLRASYSHTITRADYGSLQGGRTLDQPLRLGGGSTGSQGNPGLIPFKSKNIDLSAEWYYGRESYISVGYFNKDVRNFISNTQVNSTAFDLHDPTAGPRYRAAVAALGSTDALRIRDYILQNFPGPAAITTGTDVTTGLRTGSIIGLPEDDLVNFKITQPFNSDQKANIHGFEFAIQNNFWDTGFGVILNYTIVDGDAKYDNALDPNIGQFALAGLSDSANAVAFYDKNGLQARVAYNWRAQFYAGGSFDPTYVEAYGQVDGSASYAFTRNLSVFVEGINLTGADRRGHRRSDNFATFSQPGEARYSGGVRLTF